MNKTNKKWLMPAIIAGCVLGFLILGGAGYLAYSEGLFEHDDTNDIVELTPEFIQRVQQYDGLHPFCEGRAGVLRDSLWGYINTKGEEVIPCQYKSVHGFYDGLAQVETDDTCYYINRRGKIIITGEGGRFSEGKAVLVDGSVVDTKGNVLFKTEPLGPYVSLFGGSIFPFPYYTDGVLCIETFGSNGLDGEIKYYNAEGKEIPEPATNKISNTQNQTLYKVFSDSIDYLNDYDNGNRTGLKDSQGNIVIPAKYSGIGHNPYKYDNCDYRDDYEGFGDGRTINNGVVLVTLKENDYYHFGLSEDGAELAGFDGCGMNFIPRYCAFADLKGNTTFSKDVLAHIEVADKAGKELWQKAKEAKNNLKITDFVEIEGGEGIYCAFFKEETKNTLLYKGFKVVSERKEPKTIYEYDESSVREWTYTEITTIYQNPNSKQISQVKAKASEYHTDFNQYIYSYEITFSTLEEANKFYAPIVNSQDNCEPENAVSISQKGNIILFTFAGGGCNA